MNSNPPRAVRERVLHRGLGLLGGRWAGAALTLGVLVTWQVEAFARRPGVTASLTLMALGLSSARLRARGSRGFHAVAVRRAWGRSCRRIGLVNLSDRIPTIRRLREVPAGERLLVRVPAGRSVPGLAARAEALARHLGVHEVRVLPEPADARSAWVTLVRRDPLATATRVPWTGEREARRSLWDPLPLGLDEDGRAVQLSLVNRNVLLGGDSGTGKSNALLLLLAAAALDPDVDISLLDGKRTGLATLHPSAEHVVGGDLGEAVDVLRVLHQDLLRRHEFLLAAHRSGIQPGDGLRLRVVACDELDDYVTPGDPDTERRREFAELLRELVHLGRAVGIIVLATVRDPASVLPGALRTAFRVRGALRCSTASSSDALLGGAWARRGADAAGIAAGQPGTAYLLDVERALPVRLRLFLLPDEDLHEVTQRARLVRAAWRDLAPLLIALP